jgi:phthalate 4,5-cis-dihydrodiol dehydrogenase
VRKLKLGAAGLGRAFDLMAPALAADPRVALVAGADPRPQARAGFESRFGAKAYPSVEALCADPAVQAVYVATPHEHHAAHACLAASSKKHVLVEKPMALALEECRTMIDAARRAGVALVVGPSHSFDAPVLHARKLIASGAFGALRMIASLNFTDFLYRPRRLEELDTARGGGAVFNQAAHQVDVVRLLAQGDVRSVRAATGNWDPARATEGAYSCLLDFDNGAFASLTYSGYAHFDSDELMGWVGEMGRRKDPSRYGAARKALKGADERQLKYSRNENGRQEPPAHHPHFGLLVVSCERADLRPLPEGVMIYADEEKRLEALAPPRIPRVEVIDELYDAAVSGKPALHDGAWGMATLEVCLAILESARAGKEISLSPPVKSA